MFRESLLSEPDRSGFNDILNAVTIGRARYPFAIQVSREHRSDEIAGFGRLYGNR